MGASNCKRDGKRQGADWGDHVPSDVPLRNDWGGGLQTDSMPRVVNIVLGHQCLG